MLFLPTVRGPRLRSETGKETSVHPGGKPINDSTQSWFSLAPGPVCRAIVSRLGLPAVAYFSRPSWGSPLFEVPYVVAEGVGHI